MESLKRSLAELRALFQDRMSQFEVELQKAPSTVPSTVSLTTDFSGFKTFMLEALGCLQRQVEILAKDVDTLEMRGRRKMLLLHGVTEDSKEDTAQVVARVVQKHLQLEDFAETAIRRCHRLGRQVDVNKPRPILFKLQDVSVRDKIWYAKAKLKGSGITVAEFLTRTRHQVFTAARAKYGVTNCWTKQGHIQISGPDGTRHRIATLGELNLIAEPEQETVKPAAAVSPEAMAAPKKKRAAASKK